MDQMQARMGLLALGASIVALAAVDLVASTSGAENELLLIGAGAIPVAALAAAYLVPDRQS